MKLSPTCAALAGTIYGATFYIYQLVIRNEKKSHKVVYVRSVSTNISSNTERTLRAQRIVHDQMHFEYSSTGIRPIPVKNPFIRNFIMRTFSVCACVCLHISSPAARVAHPNTSIPNQLAVELCNCDQLILQSGKWEPSAQYAWLRLENLPLVDFWLLYSLGCLFILTLPLSHASSFSSFFPSTLTF